MFRSRVILENERGQYSSTAPFLFLRVPLLRKQTVPRRTPLGSWRIAERFFILGREVIAQVDLDFSFRIPRGRSFRVRVFCFIFLWSSVVLRFLFLRVPLLRKQTVPRRTALGYLRIAEVF